MYASGGGGTSQAKPASDLSGGLLSGLGGLLGGGKNAGSNVERQIAFDSHQSNDIWHSNTDMNLFQIVSDRIGKSTSRWTLPGF